MSKEVRLSLRVTEKLSKDIKREDRKNGMTITEFVEYCVTKEIGRIEQKEGSA